MKPNKLTNSATKLFDELPKKVQEIVRDAILEAAQDRKGPEGFKRDEEAIEEIECRSRDGFAASITNRGGLEYKNFTDLMAYWGGGYSVAHNGADKEIERQIEYSLECLSEDIFEQYKHILTPLGLTQKDCNYSSLTDLEDKHPELRGVLHSIEDGEHGVLGGEYSSIMHSIRFMYHGEIDGMHYASVSAAVNTEGPYHRSHIPWASNVFCEGAKEVEISWHYQSELKSILKKALAKVSKAVF